MSFFLWVRSQMHFLFIRCSSFWSIFSLWASEFLNSDIVNLGSLLWCEILVLNFEKTEIVLVSSPVFSFAILFFTLKNFNCYMVNYSVVLVSSIQQSESDSITHTHTHTHFFQIIFLYRLVEFSRSVVSDSLWPHEL